MIQHGSLQTGRTFRGILDWVWILGWIFLCVSVVACILLWALIYHPSLRTMAHHWWASNSGDTSPSVSNLLQDPAASVDASVKMDNVSASGSITVNILDLDLLKNDTDYGNVQSFQPLYRRSWVQMESSEQLLQVFSICPLAQWSSSWAMSSSDSSSSHVWCNITPSYASSASDDDQLRLGTLQVRTGIRTWSHLSSSLAEEAGDGGSALVSTPLPVFASSSSLSSALRDSSSGSLPSESGDESSSQSASIPLPNGRLSCSKWTHKGEAVWGGVNHFPCDPSSSEAERFVSFPFALFTLGSGQPTQTAGYPLLSSDQPFLTFTKRSDWKLFLETSDVNGPFFPSVFSPVFLTSAPSVSEYPHRGAVSSRVTEESVDSETEKNTCLPMQLIADQVSIGQTFLRDNDIRRGDHVFFSVVNDVKELFPDEEEPSNANSLPTFPWLRVCTPDRPVRFDVPVTYFSTFPFVVRTNAVYKDNPTTLNSTTIPMDDTVLSQIMGGSVYSSVHSKYMGLVLFRVSMSYYDEADASKTQLQQSPAVICSMYVEKRGDGSDVVPIALPAPLTTSLFCYIRQIKVEALKTTTGGYPHDTANDDLQFYGNFTTLVKYTSYM
mmetsp:Transcript_6984/g.17882  ORF Transcript_6984/g.17882 Transcript_6984/m.17882 type:complete len:609 (+) Transcript_6984:186-2012(+)